MREKRPSKWQMYMDVAAVVASRSHDEETAVGAVLVKDETGAIIATGCNGFVRGAPDKKLPATRPHKYKFIVHAEQNLIANCARHGISMEGCTLVCTMSPCVTCMRMMYQCGITRVVAAVAYKDFEAIQKMGDISVAVSKMPEGFLEITYREVDPNAEVVLPAEETPSECEALKKKSERLQQDLQDIRCFDDDYRRCKACGHLVKDGYTCSCGHLPYSFDCECEVCGDDSTDPGDR